MTNVIANGYVYTRVIISGANDSYREIRQTEDPLDAHLSELFVIALRTYEMREPRRRLTFLDFTWQFFTRVTGKSSRFGVIF